MNRRTVILAFSLLVAIGSLVCLQWPPEKNPPSYRLKIVRQAKEQGKSVVFFRVEGGNNRQRIQIKNVVRDAVGTTDGAFDVSPGQTNGFWAPSHVWPIDDPGKGRKEFGVLVPTKAPV